MLLNQNHVYAWSVIIGCHPGFPSPGGPASRPLRVLLQGGTRHPWALFLLLFLLFSGQNTYFFFYNKEMRLGNE